MDFAQLKHSTSKIVAVYATDEDDRLICRLENGMWAIWNGEKRGWAREGGCEFDTPTMSDYGWDEVMQSRPVWEANRVSLGSSQSCTCDTVSLWNVGCPSFRGGKCRSM